MKVDAKRVWNHMEKNKVDDIFECIHKALLSLQQKIKDGTATSEECDQALALVNQLGMADLLPLVHENKPICNLDLHLSTPGKITEDAGDDCSLLENNEGMDLRIEGESAETPSKFYQDHVCSKKCLSKRPWDSYKGENPLKLPLLCHFQRWHARADSGSKSYDVIYKAPCGKSLRNFKDVQNYLFQTGCSFLFLDHFSFNTYVQLFRSSSSPQAFITDPDISQGAETVPVSFCNDINHDWLPCFKYQKTSWPRGYFLNNFSSSFLDSCGCTDGCIDRTKCRCLLLTKRAFLKTMSPKNGSSHGYTYKRLEEPISSGVYECSLLCSCDKNMCQNRLVQHGLQVRLQVFSTEKKGWGVRCLDDIDKGTFVCTYAGKLRSRDEHYQGEDSGEIEEEVTKKTNQSLFSRKRKLGAVCSDSENELTQNTGRQSLHLNAEGQPNRVQNYTSYKNVQAIARPKTKTSLLQKHRRELVNILHLFFGFSLYFNLYFSYFKSVLFLHLVANILFFALCIRVYECSLLCSCDKNMCQNRLVQHGLQVRLQVFSTEKKGWGVRCLDDIDKGTFVCTYAGKLMSRDEHYQGEDSGEIEEVTKKTNQSLFSRKRKLGAVCSDSENELTQNTGRQQSLHLNAEGQPNRRVQNYTSYKNVQAIARPKTKTSLLQKHRRELGITDASSDEDEISLCQVSGTTRITPATKKGDEQSSLQGKCEKLANARNSEANPDCHKENLLSDAVLKSKLPMQDDKEVKKQHKGKTQRTRQELACMKEAAEIETCPKNEENTCLVDATREGNVGRFLNHSCSPNLFVQSVFVETHDRNFPWVAFFTKRHVKAGTELTWDYGYEAGSMPEAETTCQCGSLKCRKKIL
ncbi:histone-lysine N-methyltransferase SETDB2 [Notechis scutatus]|uniref:Histone-lysine N-methyltransferase SETDB2 n=1 Tax=Notechis scutatus TaxID=8663 RepID=A0A6J1UWI1_9SAUR|nr:histone-lysine N-methyltransferase SETDB2 [Notechis scutatus]